MLHIMFHIVFYRVLFLPTRSSLDQSHVSGLTHPLDSIARIILSVLTDGYNYPAIGIKCRNRKHKRIVFSSRGDSAERGARKGDREEERERE